LVVRILLMIALLVALVGMILAGPVVAQTDVAVDASAAAAGTVSIKYFDFFVVKGGYIAFGLIALSIVTIALAIDYGVSIRRATIVSPGSAHETKKLIDQHKYVDALQYTSNDPSMMGCVLNAALLESRNGFAAMERAMEESLDDRSARLFRKIEYVSIIGNVSPMIGLLGTVMGMILLFAEIHAADAFPGARIVADRISIALITTFWGLAVAIPALSIYAIFRNRIDVLTAECALAAEQIIGVFKPSETPESSTPASPNQSTSES